MTTVFRLPEEPPVGDKVTSATGAGPHYERIEDGGLSSWQTVGRSGPIRSWAGLLEKYPEGLVVVEPDPHPTPWTAQLVERGNYVSIHDANGDYIGNAGRVAALRIVDAVNKAATP